MIIYIICQELDVNLKYQW